MESYYHYLDEYKPDCIQNRGKINWPERYRTILDVLQRTPTVVSREIGFSDENIYEVLNGKSVPSFEMLADTVRYLHINPEWIFYPENDAPMLKDNLRKRDTNNNIAQRIRELMNGASYRSFARRCGSDYQSIKRLAEATDDDQNTQLIGETVIHKIADVCDVGFEWIFSGDENAREYPCNKKMIAWLETQPEVRKEVFSKMKESDPEESEKMYGILKRAAVYEEKMNQSRDFVDKEAVGERIKTIRNAYNCSLRDFQKVTGVSKSTLCGWENGKSKPDDFALRRISESLNIGKNWILYGDEQALSWPCDKRMIEFLKEKKNLRRKITKKMGK